MVTRLEHKIIIALDYSDAASAMNMVRQLIPERCSLKVGLQLFIAAGPPLVEKLVKLGYRVFLDLKFKDIPETVANACDAAADLGVWMINLHADGTRKMMMAARERLDRRTGQRPLLAAVTVLTSMGDGDLEEIGILPYTNLQVGKLASLANACRVDALVCSGMELQQLRPQWENPHARPLLNKNMKFVVPGTRSLGTDRNDQFRVVTPKQAVTWGGNDVYLVIGRQVTHAPDPMVALDAVEAEISVT